MTLGSRVLARLARLPPARTHRVRVERDLGMPMPDGAVLLADRLVPEGGDRWPVVLVRTPYGRRGLWGLLGRAVAERGYQVVIQSCRGTFGSGGRFEPLWNERSDGLATLEWLRARPWFGGAVGMMGPSYLGYVQWAVAVEAPPGLAALAPQITGSEFGSMTYPGGGFALDTTLTWLQELVYQETPLRAALAQVLGRRDLERAFRHLPLVEADEVAFGRRIDFYRNWLEAPTTDATPDERDFSGRVGRVEVPVALLGGWYDIFLPRLLADYAALAAAGRIVRLTVGPWRHMSPGAALAGLRESLAWFDAHLRGDPSRLRRAPVRVFIMGRRRWRNLEIWPPPSTPVRLHLRGGGRLAPEAATGAPDESPDRYRYDPADPTPAVGGIVLGLNGGRRDNRRLEARSDVLTYTTESLATDVEVIGPVRADLTVRSSLDDTDFFVRLCDVEPNGRSLNVCDGAVRLVPGRPVAAADGTRRVRVELWPTAYLFRAGHGIRLQVSGGAHPRIARNLGGGESLGTATTLRAADHEIFHDATHASAVVLPVTSGAESLVRTAGAVRDAAVRPPGPGT